MLRPQDTNTRETKRLDGIWSFQLDGDSEGRDARWFSADLPAPRDMAVPATLMRTWGHMDLGVYAKVVEGGTVSVGSEVGQP